MSKVNLFLLFAASILCSSISSYGNTMKVDTIYYDKDWKVLDSPYFAHYYRVAEISIDTEKPKNYRDYYISGEIAGEGKYLFLDDKDDAFSTMDGEYITYYKSGKIEQKGFKNKGIENGEYIKYFENGSIMRRCNILNNRLHGLFTEFTEGGLCIQMEYDNGEPKTGYYTITDFSGHFSKVNVQTSEPVWESPRIEDILLCQNKGVPWKYYLNDGLEVSLNSEEVNDYGKYYRVNINITNRSFYPIEFDPTETRAVLSDEWGSDKDLKVQTSEEYAKRIKRTQRWEEFVVGLSNAISSASTGYMTSVSSSYQGNNKSTRSHGSIYSYGGGRGSSYGTLTTTVTTVDLNAIYNAQMQASNSLGAFIESNRQVREEKDEGYLKLTTIFPGESVSGYINVVREEGLDLDVILDIEGAKYHFPWSLVSDTERAKALEDAKNTTFKRKFKSKSDLASSLKMSCADLKENDILSFKTKSNELDNWFEANRETLSDNQIKKWEKLSKEYQNQLRHAKNYLFIRMYNSKSDLLSSIDKRRSELSPDDVSLYKNKYKVLEDWFVENKQSFNDKQIEKWEALTALYGTLLTETGLTL